MGAATEAVPDLADALILLAIGLLVTAFSISQIWAAVRHHAFYGLGGVAYHRSPAAFWGHLLLLLGTVAIGGLLAAQGVIALMVSVDPTDNLDYLVSLALTAS
jgi:hypothetical protein